MDEITREKERARQIAKLIEASTDADKQAIEQERQAGHGLRIRREAEDMTRMAIHQCGPVHISTALPGLMADILHQTRRQALIRDNYRCQRCGADAVIACYTEYAGGQGIENMVSLCGPCHGKLKLK